MPDTIRVLIVEDSPNDAELVAEALRSAGLAHRYERVDTPERMSAALDRDGWDVVIADYKMPGFGCFAALKMIQDRGIDLPFVVVSGAIGEETAVEAMRAGAHDYVLKQNLTRLAAAVTRELREAQIRLERRQAIEAIRELARRSTFLAEASSKLAAVSLDYEETLARATRTPLPEAADWCLLTVAEGPASFRAFIAHVDPEQETWARERLRRCPVDPAATRGAVQVIRTGRSEETALDTVLISTSPAEAGELTGTLGHHSGICVPVGARGRTIGAMTLVRVSPSRPFRAGDVEFAEELATRAAVALDNATLYREACEAIRARDEFLSVASHELNTPLATLTLQLDEMVRSPARPPQELADRGMLRARRQVERLSRLVRDLLDVSRITTGHIELRLSRVDLAAVTNEVVAQFAPELARAGCPVELDVDGGIVGRWDPARVEQVIGNLLSNACKYGAGKPILISVRGNASVARLSVQDHGIGISPADRTRIFERFERAASERHYGGLGLGLYIARQVVQAHGGTIAVASRAGAGSTFTVELPLEAQRWDAQEASHVAEHS